jgi:hypothetical protein
MQGEGLVQPEPPQGKLCSGMLLIIMHRYVLLYQVLHKKVVLV